MAAVQNSEHRAAGGKAPVSSGHIVVIGAGAAGLMAAREIARAGKRVTILEARDRCGGRIHPLPAADFGYPAEGGAEFVHGEAPVTRALLGEAGLSLSPVQGGRWNVEHSVFSRDDNPDPHAERLHQALAELKADLPVAAFLKLYFAAPEYSRLRRNIQRMVEGYDVADPERASTLALADEWMNGATGAQARIVGGYGALIDFLMKECRRHGAIIHLNAAVTAIEAGDQRIVARCANGDTQAGDAAILTVPLPLLREIALPAAAREMVAAAADIGFGSVVKILLRFETRWWAEKRPDLADLLFLLSDERIPVWWTQHPTKVAVLTGWFGGPKTKSVAHLGESELVQTGLRSLAGIFGLSTNELTGNLVAARAINWANDPFARGAYSYATLHSREAQSVLSSSNGASVFISGEALYRGRDMGTVEAALASGLETAHTMLASEHVAKG